MVNGEEKLVTDEDTHFVFTRPKAFVGSSGTVWAKLDVVNRKPRQADFTDAGPEVGVSNFEVKFRDAEIARLHKSDYRIRVHRSRGDSGQGEAERTNSAIGEALVDGGTINWEHYRRFEDMTKETIENMTLEDYESYEKRRMEKNAWFVTEEICNRIQDAPVLSQYIQSHVSSQLPDMFFFNYQELQEYHLSSKEKRDVIPGSAYIHKIISLIPGSAYIHKIIMFIEKHYIQGELFFEYLKHSCSDDQTQLCEYCLQTEWMGPYMQRIPQPIPDLNRPGHFKDVWDTSFLQEDGTSRVPDDWQPRANIIKRFKDCLLNNAEAVTNFAKEFCVDEIHVQAYVTHIVNLKNDQNIRSNDRKLQIVRKVRKQYEDYDWEKLVLDRNLNRLLVHELDKYLDEHKLSKTGKKSDKVKLVTRHVLSNSEKGHNQRVVSDDEAKNSGEDVEEVCSDEDEIEESEDEIEESEEENIVLAEIGESDDNDHDDIGENESDEGVVHFTTRSGRRATRFNLHK
ncbi:unnamed protein product [Mytilus coruscus]|uniref:Transient receptor potential cation channel subfamily A member 1 n=1 Tax=Mytilus coruscus TaxID=42192 RepID=A0A6J8DA71_MYTCO|nr:unnamed protein product [Mytilus coruscus]